MKLFKNKNKPKAVTYLCVVGIFVFFIVLATSAMAISSKPSLWAVEKVNLAANEGLIPDDLKNSYHQAITREEYAELMLNVFNKTGKNISISNKDPFIDIESSKRKEILIKSYNAGFIKGFGNGIFKPGESITREQIAALLTTFIKLIDPTTNTNPKNSYDFVDKRDISNWSLPMVTYCYENQILKGTALLTINPKASTTCEQAIILAYNVAEKFEIVKKVAPLKPDIESLIKGSENLSSLKQNLGESNANVISKVISELPQNPYFENAFILKDILKISFLNGTDQSRVYIANTQEAQGDKTIDFITTGFRTMYPSNQDYVNTYLQLLSTSKYKKQVTEAVNSAIKSARETYQITPVQLAFDKDEYFRIYSTEAVKGVIFCFELHEKK